MSAALKLEVIEAQEVQPVRRWRLVMTKPGAEKLAKAELNRQGFEVYLPMAISSGEPSAQYPKGKPFVRPFFPGYLFVRFCTDVDRWRCILSTHGVKTVVMAADRPIVAPDRIVETVRQREEAGLIKMCDPRDAHGRFKKGQACLWSTPKADFEVVFDELVDKNRAAILFNWLGRETRQVVTLLTLR